MPELFVQPPLETNAQIFRGVATVPAECMLIEPEPQLTVSAPVETVGPYEPQHRSIETVSLSERWRTSTVRRKIGVVAAAAAAFLATSAVFEATPAAADDGGVYSVVGTQIGVYTRNSPHINDTERKDGLGAYDGDRVQEICGVTNGDPVGERNNHTWHKVKDLDRPDEGIFWISDHWLNTPNPRNKLTPGEADCNDTQQHNSEPLQPAETVKPFINFDRSAAEDWTISHAMLTPPPGVDACTDFASHALAAGGLPQNGTWNLRPHNIKRDGEIRFGSDTAWIAPELATYLNTLPYVDVIPLGHMNAGNNNIPKAKPGDVIAYVWNGDGMSTGIESLGNVEHLSVVVGVSRDNPQYPLVAEWGRDKATPYPNRGWTYSMKSHGWLQDEEDDNHVKTQTNMFAYLIHIRTEDDVNIN